MCKLCVHKLVFNSGSYDLFFGFALLHWSVIDFVILLLGYQLKISLFHASAEFNTSRNSTVAGCLSRPHRDSFDLVIYTQSILLFFSTVSRTQIYYT